MRLFRHVLPLLSLLACASFSTDGMAQASQSFEHAAAAIARSHLLGDSISAMRTQSSQIRARQLRVREARRLNGLPLVDSTLTLADDRLSAPLKLRDRGLPPGVSIAPSATLRVNSYVAGSLYSSEADADSSDLTTGGVTVGADYGFDESLLFGLAVTRMQGDHSSGNAVAAYLSLEPIDEVFLDLSASSGSYASRARVVEPVWHRAMVGGQSRGYSVQLTHSRHYGDWSISPFSRYEWVETEARLSSTGSVGLGQQYQSLFSIGGLITTSVSTPIGTVHPRLLLELQRESTVPGGLGLAPTRARQGLVGVGLTTRLTREVSAFAESRLRPEQGAPDASEKRALVGLRMRF